MRKCVNRELLNSQPFRNCWTLSLHETFEKGFKFHKRWKYWSLKETETSHKHETFHEDNPGQNICNRVKKWSKIRQEQKTFLTTSAQLFAAISKMLFLERRLALGSISTQFLNFSITPYFCNALSLKSLGKLWNRQLVCNDFYTRCKSKLYLRWSEIFLKCCKIPEYYVHDSRLLYYRNPNST